MARTRTSRPTGHPHHFRPVFESLEERRLMAGDLMMEQHSDRMQTASIIDSGSDKSNGRVFVTGVTDLPRDIRFEAGDEVHLENGSRFEFDSPKSGYAKTSTGDRQRYTAVELVPDRNWYSCTTGAGVRQRECLVTLMASFSPPGKNRLGRFFDETSRFRSGRALFVVTDFYGIPINEPSRYTNPENPYDVDANGEVSDEDAQAIIAKLNTHGTRLLTEDDRRGGFVDVNGDQILSPIDALLVINFRNKVEIFSEYRRWRDAVEGDTNPNDPNAIDTTSIFALPTGMTRLLPALEVDDSGPLTQLDTTRSDDAAYRERSPEIRAAIPADYYEYQATVDELLADDTLLSDDLLGSLLPAPL